MKIGPSNRPSSICPKKEKGIKKIKGLNIMVMAPGNRRMQQNAIAAAYGEVLLFTLMTPSSRYCTTPKRPPFIRHCGMVFAYIIDETCSSGF